MQVRHVVVLVLALVVSFARTAAADVPPAPEHDAVFKNGLDQYSRGNNIGAIATWESLLGTLGEERGYKVLYNLGLAYQAIGDVTHAIERYGAFVKQVRARTEVARELTDRAADAQSRLEQLERTNGAVDVHAPKRGGLVLTRIGAAEPRAAGYVVWLAPGHHDLEIFVGTDHVKKMTLDVLQGQTLDVDTSPAETPAPPPPPAPPPQPVHVESSSTLIWVGAGATLASLALPITLYLVAESSKNSADALGPGHSGYPDARQNFDTLRTAQYVSYALPAVLGLATLGYALLRPSRTTVAIGPTSVGITRQF